MIGEGELPDFGGKVVLLYVSGGSRLLESGVLLESAAFRVLGGRLFLLGRIPEFGGQWLAQLESAVAWDSVHHYVVFDSPADYLRRIRDANPGIMKRVLRR